jgi:hypothetical protein
MENTKNFYYDSISLSTADIEGLHTQNKEIGKPIVDEYDKLTNEAKDALRIVAAKVGKALLSIKAEGKTEDELKSERLEKLKTISKEEEISISMILAEVKRQWNNEKEKKRHEHLMGFYALEELKLKEQLLNGNDFVNLLEE